jgi:hypothetical protein
MVNSHYDSAPLAPGAADAAVHCAVELELIRNILSKDLPPLNPIILLFNNGEELGLLGSVAFMRNSTSWARNIARFVNLDSMAGAGKEILYRVYPGSIVTEYNVPYPHANVIGEEIMQFIPNESDFSSFINRTDRYSNPNFVLNGIDFALYRYGFNYHTLGDLPKTLTPGGVQHIGENVLQMLNEWGYKPFGILSDARYIYFDVAGLVFVKVPEVLSTILQVILLVLFVVTPLLYVVIEKILFEYMLSGTHGKDIQNEKPAKSSMLSLVCESSFMLTVYFLGYLLSIGLCFAFGMLVGTFTGLITPLSWYSSTTFGIFLFLLPSLIGLLFGQVLVYHTANLFCCKRYSVKSMNKMFQKERFLSVGYVMFLPIAFAMFFKIRAAYLLTIQGYLLYFAICVALATDLICTFFAKRGESRENTESISLMDFGDGRIREEDEERSKLEYYKDNLWKPEESKKGKIFLEFVARNIWILVPFFNILPCMLFLDAFFTLLSMFIPTAGRMTMLTDPIFAAIVCLAVVYVFVIFLPLVHRAANFTKIFVILFAGLVITLVISWFMAPYTANSQKRYILLHNITSSYTVEGSTVTVGEQTTLIRATKMDSIPASYGIGYFKGINNTSCQTQYCTFDAPLNVKPFGVVSTGTNGAFDVTLTFEASHRVFVNFTGKYTVLVTEGGSEGNGVFSKKGSQSNSWKFTFMVAPGDVANLGFTSYYLGLEYTPYLNQTVSSVDWITVTGNANFLTQNANIAFKG